VDYMICAARDKAHALASSDFDSDYLAEKWAREWAKSQDVAEDYLITRSDGAYAASLFRTVGGQWYIMLKEPTG